MLSFELGVDVNVLEDPLMPAVVQSDLQDGQIFVQIALQKSGHSRLSELHEKSGRALTSISALCSERRIF